HQGRTVTQLTPGRRGCSNREPPALRRTRLRPGRPVAIQLRDDSHRSASVKVADSACIKLACDCRCEKSAVPLLTWLAEHGVGTERFTNPRMGAIARDVRCVSGGLAG